MSLSLSYLLINTHGDFRASYLFGDILLMMCASVISRPRLVYTVVGIALQCLCFQSVLFLSDAIVPRDRVVSILFSLSGGIVSIMTAYELEETSRRVFLLGLRVRLLNSELEIMAKTDPLTGLGNRRIFAEVVERVWTDRARAVETASIILIDLDHFKAFNDNYGHPAGDSCLQIIARCVKDALRDERNLGVRFGGEELLVLALDADLASARAIAETIRQSIRAAKIPHPAIGNAAFVTASFGVATSLIADCTATELVSRADIALYAAKQNGRDQIWPRLDAPLCQPEPSDPYPCGRDNGVV